MLHAAVLPSLPSTAVTHSVAGRFSQHLPSDVRELVVVRQNHLSLYRGRAESALKAAAATSDEEGGLETVLQLVAEVSLNAPPLSAAVCKPSSAAATATAGVGGGAASVDVLVLLFDDFHVSFLQFNALTLEFDTVALVQLDDRDTTMERCPLAPIMRVDPAGTYVGVLSKRRELFVFPVLQRASREAAAAAAAAAAVAAPAAAAGGSSVPAAEETAAAAPRQWDASEPKAPKVTLDAWGDDEDDDDDDHEDKAGKEAREVPSKTEAGSGAEAKSEEAAHTGLSSGKARTARTGGDQVCLVNEEVLMVGPVTKLPLADLKPAPLNVRDFQFVETSGGEPLLAFLYERDPTWAGRAKLVEWRIQTIEAHMLTCAILWVRWTLANTRNPKPLTIGDVEDLPYNVTNLVPLPAFQQVPSAVLAVGQNTIVHVSIKNGYGAYVNANGKEEVQGTRSSAVVYEPLRWSTPQEEKSLDLLKTNLNFANSLVVVADPGSGGAASRREEDAPLRLLVITEKFGTVVALALKAGGYSVSSIEGRMVMSGCYANCWSALGAGCHFLGSFCGDSRVVRWAAGGSKATAGSGAHLQLVQSFTGLGPVQDVDVIDSTPGPADPRASGGAVLDPSVAQSPFADLFQNVSFDPEPPVPMRERRQVMDLALCSGQGSAGSVCVLRQSIRNEVIRQEEVNAVSVFFMENKKGLRGEQRRKRARDDGAGAGSDAASASSPGEAGGTRDRAAHLLVTGNRFTILFAVRSDAVQQVRGTVLNVTARTVFAAELDWAPALLQVTETAMYVCSLDGKRSVNQVVLADLLAGGGSAHDSGATKEGGEVELVPSTTHGRVRSAFLLSAERAVVLHFEHGQVALVRALVGEDGAASAVTATPLLENVRAVVYWSSRRVLLAVRGEDLVLVDPASALVTHTFPQFAVLPKVAVDGVPTPLAKLSERLSRLPFPTVTHLHMFDHPAADGAAPDSSPRGTATLAIITSSGELLTYRVIPADAIAPMRLVKAVHHLLDIKADGERMETIEEKKRRLALERAKLESDTIAMLDSSERLIPFRNIGGCEGVYVCGQHPVFLIYDEERGELVATRHQTSGAVRGFSPFQSRHVDGGYVYCCEGYVHFATMRMFGQSIGRGWWMQRVPLGVTPHQVVYSAAAQSCYVVTSSPQPFSQKRASFDVQLRITYDEQGQRTSTVEQAPALPALSAANTGAPVPLNDRYEVKFFSCADWSCTDTLTLEENEKVLSAQCIALPRDTSMDVGPRAPMGPVCVLATAFPLGEDITTRGRLLLLGSRHADGENKLRVLHSEPLKGPATAVTGIEGNIAVAVGGTIRVFRYDFRTTKLETMAILYAGAYVTRMSAFRHYLVFGDLYRSVGMARFSAENHTLTVLGKDVNALSVVSAEALYHGGSLGIVVSDDDRNMVVMGYTPRLQATATAAPTSGRHGAEQAHRQQPRQQQQHKSPPKVLESLLTIDGEYRLAGGCLLKLLRFRSTLTSGSPAVYVTNYGEVGFIVPLSAQANLTSQLATRRLQMHIPPAAGLPPRMFLALRQDDAKLALCAQKKLTHAPLLEDLFRLDARQRRAVAAEASTQIERVLNVGAVIASEAALF